MTGGPYTISASGAIDADYTISFAAGSLTVTPVALTITASNQTKAYGAALPTLTATYSGFVNGDTKREPDHAADLDDHGNRGEPCDRRPVRRDLRRLGAHTVDADYYTIGYATGSSTVTPVALTITAANQTKAYEAPRCRR